MSTDSSSGSSSSSDQAPASWGYVIPRQNDTVDITVHGVGAHPKALEQLNDVMSVVYHLQPILIAWDTVERNHAEIVEAFQLQEARMHKGLQGGLVPLGIAHEGLCIGAQKITNFLSAATGFLTQANRRIRAKHGERSQAFRDWDTERKNLHAGSFAYRFLYELRNYAQHAGLPITNFRVRGERGVELGPMRLTTAAQVERDKLLSEGYEWGKIRPEIEQQAEEFDLLPLIAEYLGCLRAICLHAVQIEGAGLARATKYFEAFQRAIRVPEGAIAVYFYPSPRGQPPSRWAIVPREQFRWVASCFDRLLSAVHPTR